MNLVCITEVWGENQSKVRETWVNPKTISRFTEDYLWRAEGHAKPRVTRIRFVDGDSIIATESPECIAAHLSGEHSFDPLLTVAQAAALAEVVD
jgi:hypothetical protein